MTPEHRPIFLVVWIDAKGRRDLCDSVDCLYSECHIDHCHMAYVSEADANHIVRLMERQGTEVLIPVSRRLPE